jgi:hypothetical protein
LAAIIQAVNVDSTIPLWQVLVALVCLGGAWGGVLYKLSVLESKVAMLEKNSQTPNERFAEAKLIQSEFEAHTREDKAEFARMGQRIETLEAHLGGMDGKLDRILIAVNGRGRGTGA